MKKVTYYDLARPGEHPSAEALIVEKNWSKDEEGKNCFKILVLLEGDDGENEAAIIPVSMVYYAHVNVGDTVLVRQFTKVDERHYLTITDADIKCYGGS